jgi:hypothetical protein
LIGSATDSPEEWDVQFSMHLTVGSRAAKRHLYDRFANKLIAQTSHRPYDMADLTLLARFDGEFYTADVASLSDTDVDEAVTALLHTVKLAKHSSSALIPLGGGSGRAA